MLDIAVAYNQYKFIGYEFLTWIWFTMETDAHLFTSIIPGLKTLYIGNRIMLENRKNNNIESITIKGDEAEFEEGHLSIKKGAFISEMNLVLEFEELEWKFSIKGENLCLAGLKPPKTGALESQKEVEGAILERVYLLEKITSFLDMLFEYFIKLRVSSEWETNIIPAYHKWISN